MSIVKVINCLTIVVCLVSAVSFHSYSQVIEVMSFNIRYDNPKDGENAWSNRKRELVGLLDFYHPDFLGSQEGLEHQLKYIDTYLTEYSMIGVAREDGKNKGEYAAIFYDSTKYQLVLQNTFWLSENPEKVSVGWDAVLERICTYGLFKSKESDEMMYVFNAHFDHVGIEAQMRSAELIIKKIDELADDNAMVVLMGDLNCSPDSPPIKTIKTRMADGMDASQKTFYGPLGTFNSFDSQMSLDKRIDYVFAINLNVVSYRHIDDKRRNQGFISDHLPVLVKLTPVKQ